MSSEQAHEFYVTLPSNASMDIFQNNTVASYTTKLINPIHLVGNWVVGLCGISIPWSFYNIRKEEQIIIQIVGKKKIQYEIKIPPGYYDSIESIVNIIKQVLAEPFRDVKEEEEIKSEVELAVEERKKKEELKRKDDAERKKEEEEEKKNEEEKKKKDEEEEKKKKESKVNHVQIIHDWIKEKKRKEAEQEDLRNMHALQEIIKAITVDVPQNDDDDTNSGELQDDEALEEEEGQEEEIPNDITIEVDSLRQQLAFKYRRNRKKYYIIGMTPDIQNILGFANDPNAQTAAIHFQERTFRKKPFYNNVLAPYSYHLDYAVPSEVNVCLDIVKTQPGVGKLLRKVSVYQYMYGQMKSIIFERPHYVKVDKRYFDTLHVDLKDVQGKKLPFEFGTSSVTLHFKQK